MGDPIATASRTSTVVWTGLTCRDAAAAIRFLRDALGFQEKLAVPGDAAGAVAHAELRRSGGGPVMVRGLRDDHHYGPRGFTVRDPQGVLWSFGTYAGAC